MASFFRDNYGYVCFATFGVLGIPILFYLFNAKSFDYDSFLLLIPLILSLALMILGFIITSLGLVLTKKFNKANYKIQKIFASIGLIIFANDLFVPTEAGALDGTLADIPESISFTVLELFIIVAIAITILYQKRIGLLVRLSQYSLSISFFVLIYIYVSSGKESPETITKMANTANQSPNVYLIWLDGMQTDYFIKSLNERHNSFKKELQGFTLFKNNTSNYPYSLHSYYSFISSTLFKGKNYIDWINNDVLRKSFKQNGYRLTSYAMPDFISSLDDVNYTSYEIMEQSMALKHPYLSDFISYWAVKSSPNFLANESLTYGKRIAQQAVRLLDPNHNQARPSSVAEGVLPFAGVQTFNKVHQDEHLRHHSGEFIFTQVVLPHLPYIFDYDCNYRGIIKKGRDEDKYYEQVGCALTMIKKFIRHLKQLDRYNDSLILIYSDHGSAGWHDLFDGMPFSSQIPLNAEYYHWSKNSVLVRSSALLMIKPIKADYKFNISKKETQLIDILPTLIGLMGWERPSNLEGINVFDQTSIQREKLFTYYKPDRIPDIENMDIYKIIYDFEEGLQDIELVDQVTSYFEKNID